MATSTRSPRSRRGPVGQRGIAVLAGLAALLSLVMPIRALPAAASGVLVPAGDAGYWAVASDGGIFAFGDATFLGSTGAIALNKPIVGMAATPTGNGYWLTASDGGIFAFGDATFFGSTGAIALNKPIVGMAATPTGNGYWLTASDGGIFAFGDAAYFGAAPERAGQNRPPAIVGLVATSTGSGYWQAVAGGDVLAFGDAADLGGVSAVNRPLVAMAARPAGRGPAPGGGVIGSGDGTGPGDPGGAGPPPVTTTTTTGPPVGSLPPDFFSADFEPSWGTSPSEDPNEDPQRKAGRVLAVAEAGDVVFVAGEFAGVTPPGVGTSAATKDPGKILRQPYLVALDADTGELLDWDAQPNEAVLSLAVSPDGRRLYVGGRFRKIGGGPAGRIAALDIATGRLDPTFQPPLADSGVRAMALAGDTLYVGGNFTRIGDVDRPGVAALDATTGALRTGFVPPANTGGRYTGQTGVPTEDGNPGLVWDLAVTDDGRLVVAGDFLHFGDQGGLLVLNGRTGEATPWQPDIGRPVHGVAVWPGDGTTFFAAAGGTGGVVDAYRPGGPTKALWRHRVDGDATDVTATTKRVYLVGHYDYVLGKNTICGSPPCTGGQDGDIVNRHISAFDALSGAHDLDYAPQLNTPQGPYVAHLGQRRLYIGGDFTKVNGEHQPGFVKFPAAGWP